MTTQTAPSTFRIMTCAICGASFTARAGVKPQKYCSKDCRVKSISARNKEQYELHKDEWKLTWQKGKGETVCDVCKFTRDCETQVWDVKFTPYCFRLTIDDAPNRLHRLWGPTPPPAADASGDGI